jgi:hypothetical protein
MSVISKIINRCRMTLIPIVMVIACVLPGLWCSVSAIVVDPTMEFIVENETYRVNFSMVFDQVITSDTFIVFNTTGFYVSSPVPLTLTLVYLHPAISDATDGEKILDFFAETQETVSFGLSGFPVDQEYQILQDGAPLSWRTADSSGFISFSNEKSVTPRFQVFQHAYDSGNVTPPVGGMFPVGLFSYPENISVNQTIVFDASESYDPDGVIVSYEWDFGDGTMATGGIVAYIYRNPGSYMVVLQVIDNTGMLSVLNQSIMVTLADGVSEDVFDTTGFVVLGLLFLGIFFGVLFLYRRRIYALFSRVDLSSVQNKQAQLRDTAMDFDALVEAVVGEVRRSPGVTIRDAILSTYTGMVEHTSKQEPVFALSDQDLEELERLVDQRIHAKIDHIVE